MTSDPGAAIAALASGLLPLGVERLPGGEFASLAGRVIASPVRLDRDSPALDVSAMDGFAVRLDGFLRGPLPVAGECRIGRPPEELPAGAALRIFTGSPLPHGADTVVRLERAEFAAGAIQPLPGTTVALGDDIRRRGENARRGATVLAAGEALTPAAVAALATVGPAEVDIFRRVRVSVITTGDEVVRSGDVPPWRLRDSNGPSLVAMLGGARWVESVRWRHAEDGLAALTAALADGLAESDAVVFTGGVSKGDHDLVRPAIEHAGGRVVFHRIAARPGQPTLGAIVEDKPVVGLPGNPLSVLCAGRRVLVPVLRKLAGFAAIEPAPPEVRLAAWGGKPQPVVWWRPVRLVAAGLAELAPLQGSGDVIGPAQTDGFVEVPPGAEGPGPYAFYPWSV